MVKSFKTNLLQWLKTKVYVKNEIDTKLQNKSDTNHTHTTATVSANGFLSKEDKSKLEGIATEANKTVVDSSLSSSSTNPVQNKIINSALNGKANSSHTHMGREIHPDFSVNSNGASTTAYRKILRITINSQYCDEPITFNLSQRTETMHNRVHIRFKSSGNNNPDLQSFYVEGIKSMPLYLYKESTSKWILLSKEVTNYDYVSISDLLLTNRNRDYFTFTPLNEQVTTLPTTNIYTAVNTVDSSLSSTSANPVQNKVITNALNGKANSTHSHDDRYYTETEMNTKLNNKADKYNIGNSNLNGQSNVNVAGRAGVIIVTWWNKSVSCSADTWVNFIDANYNNSSGQIIYGYAPLSDGRNAKLRIKPNDYNIQINSPVANPTVTAGQLVYVT